MKRIAFLLVGLLLFSFAASVFVPRGFSSDREVAFTVRPGEGTRDIALNLERQGLIYSAPLFRVFVLTAGVSGSLQAGTYLLSPTMSSFDIAFKLAAGNVQEETITIPEGWNLRDIGFSFENRGMAQAEELWEVAGFPAVDYREAQDLPLPKDFSEEFPFLKERSSSVGLEGYLFPDTYRVRPQESMESIVRKMLANFERKVLPFKEEMERQGRPLFEVVTVASMLEKEVRTPEDKKLVAGILENRLSIGMPLQVDATVSYLTGRRDTAVTKEETEIDSPFNTYKYPGLPLGPISNPGVESMEAALFPAENPYLYYLSTPEGETVFSRTLQEHNEAKAMHLR